MSDAELNEPLAAAAQTGPQAEPPKDVPQATPPTPEEAGGPGPKNRFEPVDRQERIADLVEQLQETVDKLARDSTSRGDLKIITRTVRELRYAFKIFQQYRLRRKVTVFGSARTKPHEPTFKHAEVLGRAMAAHGWLVVTGAGNGIMEAAHIGAGRENAMGINIMLPFEQSANPVIAGDVKLVHMKYFFTRKVIFVKECDAVCCLAGGFGTLDEALEVLTLLQTGKRDMVPVVFLDAPGGTYWRDFDDFIKRRLFSAKLIAPEDLSLYKVTDSVDEAVAEIIGFFHNYHSMRYVHHQLVFRLRHAPNDEQLEEINVKFADILAEGRFTVRKGPLDEERDDANVAHMARLIFRFNRRSLGRLRQLIDHLNRLAPAN